MGSGSSITDSFRRKPTGQPCKCDDIFNGFLWHELTTLKSNQLPREPGVYALRVIEMGRDVAEVIENLRKHIVQSRWNELIHFVEGRLARIKRIGGSVCPVLYIGSTQNLAFRYRSLTRGRHTVFFAVLPLLLNGWKLEYGYLRLETPDKAKWKEGSLLHDYCVKHGRIPPLNKDAPLSIQTKARSNLQ